MDGVVNQCIMPKTNKIAEWACLNVCLSILVATHTSVRTFLLLYLCLVTRDTSFCQEQVNVTVPLFSSIHYSSSILKSCVMAPLL
jgi:hypothetical protein